MYAITESNAHMMLPEVLYQLRSSGVRRDSRNGPVRVFPMPTTLRYLNPTQRVVFWPERDANPTFHLLESIWMLLGRNDVATLAEIVPTMEQFSDDGSSFNGAYGFRWRRHFYRAVTQADGQVQATPYDQLTAVAEMLRENPDCRRQVVAMWDGHHDLGLRSKDLPCNTHIYLQRDKQGRLDMMVCNRSNDIVWGAVGANVVHFTFLQEFMAGLIGCEVGCYWQTSMNMHLYEERHADLLEQLADRSRAAVSPPEGDGDPYTAYGDRCLVVPLGVTWDSHDEFVQQASAVIGDPSTMGVQNRFLRGVLGPMLRAHAAYRAGGTPERWQTALEIVETEMTDCDWKCAAKDWYARRYNRWTEEQAKVQGEQQHDV